MTDLVQTFLICAAFAIIHSATCSRPFKNGCRLFFGDTFLRVWYRFLYTCLSAVTVTAAFLLLRQVPDSTLWQAPVGLRVCMHAVQLGALLFGARAFEHLDSGEFLGVRQVGRYLARHELTGNEEGLTEKGLVTTGVYGLVRHPMYVAGIVIFTLEPTVTRNSIVITLLADLYFVFGAFLEERRFIDVFGSEYREYMKRVPRFLPLRRSH